MIKDESGLNSNQTALIFSALFLIIRYITDLIVNLDLSDLFHFT